jgi:group I intron endonuclease
MYIYKVTNLTTGQYYIGKQTGNSKSYLGSGTYIKAAVRKHGRDNFTKEILQECVSRVELEEAEKHWIQQYGAVKDPSSYNIAEGGTGGWNLTTTHIKQRTDNTYGVKLEPPTGAMLQGKNHGNSKLCIIFLEGISEPVFLPMQQAASKVGICYWTLWHYMKTGSFTNPKYIVDLLYEEYYLIEGCKYISTAAIIAKFNISKGTLHHRCIHSDRYDWWKVRKIKEKYLDYIGLLTA